jgi:hypothetical protein
MPTDVMVTILTQYDNTGFDGKYHKLINGRSSVGDGRSWVGDACSYWTYNHTTYNVLTYNVWTYK